MEILFEDQSIILAIKPPSLLSEQTEQGGSFADLLATHNGGYIGVIHRLDLGVGGVVLYAKAPASAALLSKAAQEHRLGKCYLAVAQGTPPQASGEWRDLLYYDRQRGKVFPVKRERRGVKEAILTYEVLEHISHPETGAPLSLVAVRPLTGRTHQIRVQFASRGLPLLGDRKYGGSGSTGISLWCREITLPETEGAPARTFTKNPTGLPWAWFACL